MPSVLKSSVFNMSLFPKIKQTVQLALPIVVGELGVMLMGLADTIQVGQMSTGAAESLGASGMAGSIFFTIAIVGIICIQIVSPMISKAVAEGDKTECGNLLRANLRVATLLGVVTILITGLVGLNYDLFGQTQANKALTLPFLTLISISVLPIFWFIALKSFMDGLQRTTVGMTITIIALALNVCGNHLLINGLWGLPALGLFGSGISTLLSRLFMAGTLAIYVFTRDEFKPYLRKGHVHVAKNVLEKNILRIGIPSGMQGFFEIATFGMAVVMMGWISVTAQAAHIVAINMASITYMMATGIAVAGGINVGTAIGERNRFEIKQSGHAALILSVLFMGICALVFFFGREYLVRGYTQEIPVIAIAVTLVVWGAIFQLFDGIQAVSLGLLRGLQDYKIPTAITVFSYWGIGIPMSYYLGFSLDIGAIGIWMGLTASLVCSSILLSWRFYTRAKTIDIESLTIE
jgi:MATE family multidrug resistance protein